MLRNLFIAVFASFLLTGLVACNHNKIACPTYKDSFPEANSSKKKAKPGDDKPQLPKVTRSTSVSMGPK
jgi:hypothetical protein